VGLPAEFTVGAGTDWAGGDINPNTGSTDFNLGLSHYFRSPYHILGDTDGRAFSWARRSRTSSSASSAILARWSSPCPASICCDARAATKFPFQPSHSRTSNRHPTEKNMKFQLIIAMGIFCTVLCLTSLAEAGGFSPFGLNPSNRCLDVLDANGSPGATLDSYECNNTQAQWFTTTSAEEIRASTGANLCVEVQNGNYSAGVVQLNTCNGSEQQKWGYIGGQVFPLGGNGNYCLDVLDANTSYGATVHVTGCNGTNAQLWWAWGFNTTIISGITECNGGAQLCLDDQGDNYEDGTEVDNYSCNATAAQEWFPDATNPYGMNGAALWNINGSFIQANLNSGGNNGGFVYMDQSYNSWGGNFWYIQHQGAGLRFVSDLTPASGSGNYCLDVGGANCNPGTALDLWYCNDTVAQEWTVSVPGLPD
jgi:hypothetical protein